MISAFWMLTFHFDAYFTNIVVILNTLMTGADTQTRTTTGNVFKNIYCKKKTQMD